MIDLYMWATTNSRRASIGLEEAGLEYTVHPINLQKKEQQTPEHLARNPYGKIPVLIDSDGPGGKATTVFESGAILLYAADKSGKLYGQDASERVEVQKWFMLHMNGSVAFLGALKRHPTLIPECERVMKVIDDHLANNQFFTNSFSIADLSLYPRIAGFDEAMFPISEYKNVSRWISEVGERPGVKAGMAHPK